MEGNKPIFVTQPALPPLKEFEKYLQQIWQSKILTNGGPFHQQFEKELTEYLGVKYLSVFSNGTLALITALQALKITGEVITTPFSFVATTHSMWWNNIKPVFVDIEPDTFTLDPRKVEEAITPNTTAILPVHVYGYPCKIEEINIIAKKHNLKVIYDAAHTFGARINNESMCDFGDLSILSFHATKVFNTFEGGAIICHDAKMKHHIDNLKNFGFRGELVVEEPGINAKMNELQSAMGLLQLKYIENNIAKRKRVAEIYREKLKGIDGLTYLGELPNVKQCYSYFPVLIEKEKFGISRDDLYEKFKKENIFSRRYFYPLISRFNPYLNLPSANPANLTVAEKVAEQVLCLPIYSELKKTEIDKVISVIKKEL